MNQVMLIGNLTRDPELRTTQNGVSMCTMTLAVERRFSDKNGKRETDFIPVVVWRDAAEHCARYLRKGSRAAVSGSLQVRAYTDSHDQRRTIAEVVAQDVQFLSYAPVREPATLQELEDDEPLPF